MNWVKIIRYSNSIHEAIILNFEIIKLEMLNELLNELTFKIGPYANNSQLCKDVDTGPGCFAISDK